MGTGCASRIADALRPSTGDNVVWQVGRAHRGPTGPGAGAAGTWL